jgi:multiple sugar transport system permease protein/sn-glycerol 3-phosphate transport system permease protein
MFNDRTFWQIMRNTLVFTFSTVSLTVLCAFGLALLLSLPLRGRELTRGVVFLPTLLSGAAIALVFNYILDDRYGMLTQFLRFFDIKSPSFYTDPFWAMVGIVITMVWKQAGYGAVILIAGLQGIDHTLYEAAAIDGAGRRARLWYITIPSLAPMLLFVVVTGILGAFQSFDIIKVMTNGGPVNATNVLVYNLYERGFVNFEAGPAGVLTVVIFVIMLVLTILQLQVGARNNAV